MKNIKNLSNKKKYNTNINSYNWFKKKSLVIKKSNLSINKLKVKKRIPSEHIKNNLNSKIVNLKIKNKSLNRSQMYNLYKNNSKSKWYSKFNYNIKNNKEFKKDLNLVKNNKSNNLNDKYNFFKKNKNYNKIDELNNYISQLKDKEKDTLSKFPNIILDNYNFIKKKNYYLENLKKSFSIKIGNYFNKLYKMQFIQTLNYINFHKNTYKKKYNFKSEKMILPESNKITLIFDLDETLIHCNENNNDKYDFKIPLKFPKKKIIEVKINLRPYAKEILRELSKYFQIIIFTASEESYANPVINKLDPKNKFVTKRFFRHNCSILQNKIFIKDLRIFNKSLSKIIIIDNNTYSFINQLSNGIPIIPFYNNKDDKELLYLKNFLIEIKDVADVRVILKEYFKWDIIYDNSKNWKKIIKLL